jgi:hypothetical protein
MSRAEPRPRRECGGESPVPAQFAGHIRARHECASGRDGATRQDLWLSSWKSLKHDQAVGHELLGTALHGRFLPSVGHAAAACTFDPKWLHEAPDRRPIPDRQVVAGGPPARFQLRENDR